MAVTSFQAIQPPYLLQATRVAIPVLDNDNNLTYSYMSSITSLRKLILQMTSSRIPLQSGESASKIDVTLHIVRSSDETILAYKNSSYTPRSLHVHSQLHHIHPSELCFLVLPTMNFIDCGRNLESNLNGDGSSNQRQQRSSVGGRLGSLGEK